MSDERLEVQVIRDNMSLPKWAPPIRIDRGKAYIVESPMQYWDVPNLQSKREYDILPYVMRQMLHGYSRD